MITETLRRNEDEPYQGAGTVWYLLWFVGILLMCSLSTLVPVWLDPQLKS